MSTRRRFSGDFKAKVALEALRGDKTIQEIATRHKIDPNQVSTGKQPAMEGMKEVFAKGAERSRGEHENYPFYGSRQMVRLHLHPRRARLPVPGGGHGPGHPPGALLAA